MQGVAFLREHDAGERACQHEVTGLERDAVAAELVREPSYAERRVTEHSGGNAGLFYLGILVHDAADPAQIDIEWSDRPAADHDPGGGAVIGNRIDDLAR